MEASVSTQMRARLDEYSSFHRSFANEICHFIGIPLIICGAGTLFGAVPLADLGSFVITLSEPVLLVISIFYVIEARGLGLITALLMTAFGELGRALPFAVGLGLFLFGWALQFIGHARFEGRSPAFLRNLLHLLVGPAWLVERSLWRR
jgi:uncharacterized membrane protein YGL010W